MILLLNRLERIGANSDLYRRSLIYQGSLHPGFASVEKLFDESDAVGLDVIRAIDAGTKAIEGAVSTATRTPPITIDFQRQRTDKTLCVITNK